MVNYMVAIDGSSFSKAAFYTALFMMEPQRDHLFLIAVAEKISATYPHAYVSQKVDQMIEEQGKQEKRTLLSSFRRLCHARGIKNYTAILAVSNHAGEVICEQAEAKKIDFLLLGRRGMSKLKRLFVGSTSKYCLEHAPCNLLIVKGEWGPPEEHTDIKEVDTLEEEERKRRIEEYNKRKEEAKANRAEIDDHIKKLAEETEKKAAEDKAEHPPHEELTKMY